ncbi:hypothetical protein KFU94_23945 [Chloroflexi bacterium TSY]|nr:hypothetical protein [Chloroflexi bacterium TSY]
MSLFRIHISILGLFVLLSLILSWPLAAHLTTHVPGVAQWAFDESTFIWNAWYFKQALVDNLQNPLHTELIYYPLGIDLILHTYNFFHALVAQPLFLAVNLPFGSNVALLFSTILSGYGTFLLVRYLLGREEDLRFRKQPTSWRGLNVYVAAVIGGIVYAFASNRAIYAALGHYDMVTTQWIPFYALMLLRSFDGTLLVGQRRRSAILAGIFFAFNGLAEMITALFLAIFTLIVVNIYLGQYLSHARQKQAAASEHIVPREENHNHLVTMSSSHPLTLISSLLLIGITAFILWAPVLLPILNQFLTDDFSLKGWGEAIPLSTDLLGWFTPTILHPLWGGDLVTELRRVQLRALEEGVTGFRDVNTVFLGWSSLILATIGGLFFWRRMRIWVWTTVIFGLLTLGPFLQINGRFHFDLDGVEATFPMPYTLLHYLPIIKANRAPNRNSVILMLGLAVLVAYGVYLVLGFLSRRPRKSKNLSKGKALAGWRAFSYLVTIILTSLILFEHLALPAPLSDARVPEVYERIAQDPAPVAVMHLPLGWRDGFGTWGPERTRLQYFQAIHGKPMLGGNISRAPDFKMDYFKRIPLFQALRNIQSDAGSVAPELEAAAREQASELIYLYNVGYLLLMPPIPQRFPYADHWRASWEFAHKVLPIELEPFWQGQGIEAYRLIQPEGQDDFRIDLGVAGTYPYRGRGWDEVEIDMPYETSAIWATAESSHLFVPLRQIEPTREYAIRLRVHPFIDPQSVALWVNGVELADQALDVGWTILEWKISGDKLVNSLNRFVLLWAQTAIPRQVIPGNRQIGNSGIEMPIDVELNGFAEGGFIALFDENGVQTDGSAGRNGVNATVLDPDSGQVLNKQGFDTTANQYESQALADFLRTIPTGQIVLITSRGDATNELTQEAVEGFRHLGADLTLDSVRGNYFSIIGLQGREPGSAATVLHPDGAYLRIGLNSDRRTLAAAVDWVEILPLDR